jgi:hypothetical protein
MLQDGGCEGGINALCLLDSTGQCWCCVLAVGSKAGGAEVESDGGQVVLQRREKAETRARVDAGAGQ